MFSNHTQLEAARILHYVNKCTWDVAKYHALRMTADELQHVIDTHPNWRNA